MQYGNIQFEDHGLPALCCPGCGNPEIHQQRVDVVVRDDGEDGPGTEVRVEGGDWGEFGLEVRRVCEKEIPGRRQHVCIVFRCEHCFGVEYPFLFLQHKGLTQVEWLSPVEIPDDERLKLRLEDEDAFASDSEGPFGFSKV